ncbi:uncharacterized protein LOC131687099 [Topomyia yanbarensis]|uniref:uncharacterized protein LOC131687099 n=1 Tax=Topomyia yanbarensis TaxID=2498891 RepID=UPI00273B7740|nr:uncharacterized protein LOC131687099 [Topomyia yanbarensis]
MVSCNDCTLWAHFKCAGVTDEVRDVDWFCPTCTKSREAHLRVPKNKKDSKKGSSKSETDSVRSAGSTVGQHVEQLEMEQAAREKEFSMQIALRAKRIEMNKCWMEKQLQMEKDMRERELKMEREMQNLQLKQEQELLDRQLAAEREFFKKRDAIRQQVKTSRKKLGKIAEGSTPGVKNMTDSATISTKKVQSWLSKQEQKEVKPTEDFRGAYSKGTKSIHEEQDDNVSLESHDDQEGSDEECGDEECSSTRQNLEKDKAADPEASVITSRNVGHNGPGQRIVRVTKEQLAARQAISKHLPTFRGEPEMWPLFISSFEYTTEACGFSNIDNLKRLQDSLQGDALEAVRGRLVLPDSVPDVIRDLRNLFGKPEKLLKTLLMKVRNDVSPRSDRLETFIRFGITVKQHLEAAQLNDHLNNPMLVQELMEKLPPSYKLEWVRFKRGKHDTPLRIFTDFMTDIVSDVSEISDFSDWSRNDSGRFAKEKPKKKEFVHIHDSATNRSCDPQRATAGKPTRFCKRSDHKIRSCEDFKNMTIGERLKAVETLKLCGLCLNNHGNSRCNFKLRCTVKDCGGNHHYLLHRREELVQVMEVSCNAHKSLCRGVIFRMVPVTLSVGELSFNTWAFLDEGSSSTLIEEAIAKRLRAKGETEPLIVTWTNDIKRHENFSRKINLTLSAHGCRDKFHLENVRTVSELVLPKQSVRFVELATKYQHLAGLPVADHTSQEPTILIGLDNLHLFAPLESRVGKPGEPIAVRSTLGWTVYGPETCKSTAKTFLNLHVTKTVTNQELHDIMRSHYVLDETGITSFGIPESMEDQRARATLQATTVRVGDRFQTGLLWRENERRFPDSFPMAVRRQKALEKKLEKTPKLEENVFQQIIDYQRKGYAHQATAEELAGTPQSAVWYLPLNVALNARKPDKVRLVWDAAASVAGVSLNTELLKGPDMLVALPGVISRFRERPVAFGGDIAEMYHQIRVRPEDRSAQRFLFRADPNETPKVYVMDEEFPEATEAIVQRHYMDDYFDSTDTVEEAIKHAKDVHFIHAQGGFHIRNWVSNSEEFLREMGERSADTTVHFDRNKTSDYERVLGVVWEPKLDSFSFSTPPNERFQQLVRSGERPSKRMVLSCVMALLDPLGLLSPFTVLGRMLVQDIWRTGCDWDDRIDDVSFQKWTRWSKLLSDAKAFNIPRSYFGSAKAGEIEDLQLHIFTDASETA